MNKINKIFLNYTTPYKFNKKKHRKKKINFFFFFNYLYNLSKWKKFYNISFFIKPKYIKKFSLIKAPNRHSRWKQQFIYKKYLLTIIIRFKIYNFFNFYIFKKFLYFYKYFFYSFENFDCKQTKLYFQLLFKTSNFLFKLS